MTLPATISAAIDAAAKGPASVTVDGRSVSTKDIGQIIQADQYQKAQQATTAAAGFGLRFAALKPPAAG